RNNILLFLVLLPVVGACLWGGDRRFKIIYALFAALLGIFGEWLCTLVRYWVYANPSFARLPLWLPLAWMLSMTSFLEMATWLDKVLERQGPNLKKAVVFALQAVILAYLSYTVWVLHNVVAWITLAFFAVAAPFLRKPLHTVLFVLAGPLGFLAEYKLVQAGVWHYTRPWLGVLGMPLSLPLAWGLAANLIWLTAKAAAGIGKGPQNSSPLPQRPEG
ncbi:MAG: hypothetical protein AB1921_06520, partial [Thermodesulfobacteriota bacterium]